jgi:hypothetical protein
MAEDSQTTLLEAKVFPIRGQTKKLEPQVLDFRYAPYRWQTCIGLPDDLHKSIVGSDGGLYYDYGRGRYYDFETRILARLEAKGPTRKMRQSLWDARVPIVVTEQDTGVLRLRQQAWAGVPDVKDREKWDARRVDYLWLKMINSGWRKTKGRITLQVDSKDRLVLNEQGTRLVEKLHPDKTFCAISPACASVEYAQAPDSAIVADHPLSVNRNWAQPKVNCDRRFSDIVVGWDRALIFTYPVEPHEKYRIAFGLIEGYHEQPGKRPLEIRIEGKRVRSVDLIEEFGRNKPAVFCFDAQDQNKDGL